MGNFKQVKLFIFSLFYVLIPKISYQTLTSCGNNVFFVQYPFQLYQNLKTKHHSHKEFILKCNSQGLAVLSLPLSGNFYVRDIDYFHQKIQLYDPGNCLPRRFMNNFTLSGSLFSAPGYKNYAFFSCPSRNLTGLRNSSFSVVSCMSNSTVSIVAASLVSRSDESSLVSRSDEIMRSLTGTGCEAMGGNLQIPDSLLLDDHGFQGDLQLAWNVCGGDCKGRPRGKSIIGIIILCLITISTGILGALFCIGCCLRFIGSILEIRDRLHTDDEERRSETTTTRLREMTRTALRPSWQQRGRTSGRPAGEFSSRVSTAREVAGLAAPSNDKKLLFTSSTEELMIGGGQWISGPNSDSCPICLGDYQASDRLRQINVCHHCFHALCLETWLQRKNTCPVCRVSVK